MRNQISRKITADKVVIEAECKTSYKSGSSYKAGSCSKNPEITER